MSAKKIIREYYIPKSEFNQKIADLKKKYEKALGKAIDNKRSGKFIAGIAGRINALVDLKILFKIKRSVNK